MTGAAGIELGSSGRAEPAQGLGAPKSLARAAVWGGIAEMPALTASAASAASFRSSWQSQMAALAGSLEPDSAADNAGASLQLNMSHNALEDPASATEPGLPSAPGGLATEGRPAAVRLAAPSPSAGPGLKRGVAVSAAARQAAAAGVETENPAASSTSRHAATEAAAKPKHPSPDAALKPGSGANGSDPSPATIQGAMPHLSASVATTLAAGAAPSPLPGTGNLAHTEPPALLPGAGRLNPGNGLASSGNDAASLPGSAQTAPLSGAFPLQQGSEPTALAASVVANEGTQALETLHPLIGQPGSDNASAHPGGPGLGLSRAHESPADNRAGASTDGAATRAGASGSEKAIEVPAERQAPVLQQTGPTASGSIANGPIATGAPVTSSAAVAQGSSAHAPQPDPLAPHDGFKPPPGANAQPQAANAPASGTPSPWLAAGGPATASDVVAASAQGAAGSGSTIATAAASLGARRAQNSSGVAAGRVNALQTHPVGAGGNAAAILVNPAPVPAASNTNAAGSSAAASPGDKTSAHDPFAALDADPAPGSFTWTRTGSRQAEAGFEDPTLGWVGVRAGVGSGGVHATLLPGSANAAQELNTHVEGLNAYMAQQRLPVESLGVGPPEGRAAQHGDRSPNQGMGQSGQQQSGQGRPQDFSSPEPATPTVRAGTNSPGAIGAAANSAAPASLVPESQASGAQASGHGANASTGIHISVVA